MEEKELFERYREAYDFLRKKNIYELRLYGRAVGVKRPTAKNKKNLIADIIKSVLKQNRFLRNHREARRLKQKVYFLMP